MSLTDDILMHYGMPRRSGRYPWGSGDNPYQHSGDFLSRVEELKKSNFTFTDKDGKTYTGEVAIAKSMGLSTTQFRTQMSLAKDERRSADVATAKALRAKGYSLNEIADKMGFANDSSVRSLLNESSEARMNNQEMRVINTNMVKEFAGGRELTAYLIQVETNESNIPWHKFDLKITDADNHYGAATIYKNEVNS